MKDIQKKAANKTKPLGIRINNRHLEFILEKEGLATPQQAVNFLFEKYFYFWGHQMLGAAPPTPLPADYVEFKALPERIIAVKPNGTTVPIIPPLDGFEAYKADLKNCNSIPEIELVVKEIKADKLLSIRQRTELELYAVEISKNLNL